MGTSSDDIQRIGSFGKKHIIKAFKQAYGCKDKGSFIEKNQLRSSKFVYEVGVQLKKTISLADTEILVQKVNDLGKKKSGEWLFDIVIAKKSKIKDESFPGNSVKFIKRLHWIAESESHTSLHSFAEDFAKILIAKTDNALYLNGLNQVEGNIDDYIEIRMKTTLSILKGHSEKQLILFNTLYLCFWPGPQKVKREGKSSSQWDFYSLEELTRSIRLYKYDLSKRRFREIEK